MRSEAHAISLPLPLDVDGSESWRAVARALVRGLTAAGQRGRPIHVHAVFGVGTGFGTEPHDRLFLLFRGDGRKTLADRASLRIQGELRDFFPWVEGDSEVPDDAAPLLAWDGRRVVRLIERRGDAWVRYTPSMDPWDPELVAEAVTLEGERALPEEEGVMLPVGDSDVVAGTARGA